MFPNRCSSFPHRLAPRYDSRQISREPTAVPSPRSPAPACQISRDNRRASRFFSVGRQGDGLPEVTLTLEPRLPQGCEADSFQAASRTLSGRLTLHTSSQRWPWKFPGQVRARRLFYSFIYLPLLFLLPHSLVYCSGTRACTANTETALAKVIAKSNGCFLDLYTALDETALLLILLFSLPLFIGTLRLS